jgi:hypothetical protein
MKQFILGGMRGLVLVLAVTGIADWACSQEKTSDQTAPAPKWRRIDQTQFVGSKKCAECHQAHYDGWKDSAHNKMIRPAIADGPDRTIAADFSIKSPYRSFELKDVKWVIGHRWKQRYIGEVNGKEVVFPAQWSIQTKQW